MQDWLRYLILKDLLYYKKSITQTLLSSKLYSAIKHFLTSVMKLWINTFASTVNLEDNNEIDKSRAENENAKLEKVSVQSKRQKEHFVNHILNSDSNCSQVNPGFPFVLRLMVGHEHVDSSTLSFAEELLQGMLAAPDTWTVVG